MSESLAYVDTSAFIKTIAREPQSRALTTFLKDWPARISSALLGAEVRRVVRRAYPKLAATAINALNGVRLIEVDDEILRAAGSLVPVSVGTLAAIHLASATMLGDDLGIVITYDAQMKIGAEALGLRVAAPG